MPQPHTGEKVPSGYQLWTFDGTGNLIVRGSLYTGGIPDPTKPGPGQPLIPGNLAGPPPGQGLLSGLQPSGDVSGATDPVNIAALANLGGTDIPLLAGTWFIGGTAPVSLGVGTRVRGAGPGSTIITIASGFTGSSVFSGPSGGYAEISDMTITGPTTSTAANPEADAIRLNGGRFCRVDNIDFRYVNGWCVNSVGTAGGAGYGTMLTRLSSYLNCAGGIHIQGTNAPQNGAQHFLNCINMQQTGIGGSGATSNLDTFFFEDAFDIIGSDFNGAVSSAGNGACMHIKGKCAVIMLDNMDLGCFPKTSSESNDVWLIEDNASAQSPQNIYVSKATGQQGAVGLRVTGGATGLWFTGFQATNNYTHGISVEGTGDGINFNGVYCGGNGQIGSGTNYDFQWTSTATGLVENVTLASLIGAGGVTNPAHFQAGNGAIAKNWRCTGTSISATNVFDSSANSPYIARDIIPWNPRGALTVAVPASGTPVSATGNDRWFYITPASSGTSVTVTGGNANLTLSSLPVSQIIPVFVPARATITPSYTGTAPAWQVYGT